MFSVSLKTASHVFVLPPSLELFLMFKFWDALIIVIICVSLCAGVYLMFCVFLHRNIQAWFISKQNLNFTTVISQFISDWFRCHSISIQIHCLSEIYKLKTIIFCEYFRVLVVLIFCCPFKYSHFLELCSLCCNFSLCCKDSFVLCFLYLWISLRFAGIPNIDTCLFFLTLSMLINIIDFPFFVFYSVLHIFISVLFKSFLYFKGPAVIRLLYNLWN